MEIILKEPIKKLGYKNDVVSVADGYGQFLIKSGKAIIATKANKKQIEAQAKISEQSIKEGTQKLKKQLDSIKVLKIEAKVNEKNHLFEAIHSTAIKNSLSDAGVIVSDENIKIDDGIKELGIFEAVIKLPDSSEYKLKFEVIATKE